MTTRDPDAADLEASLTKAFYAPGDVAQLVGVSPSTILNWIHAGRLSAVRLSERTYRIPRRAVLRLVAPGVVDAPRTDDQPDAAAEPTEADAEDRLLVSS